MDEGDGGSRQAGEQEADPQGEPFFKMSSTNEGHQLYNILINTFG